MINFLYKFFYLQANEKNNFLICVTLFQIFVLYLQLEDFIPYFFPFSSLLFFILFINHLKV